MTGVAKFLTIRDSTSLLQISADELVFIKADGNYTHFYTRYIIAGLVKKENDQVTSLTPPIVTKKIGTIKELLKEQLGDDYRMFRQVGKSLLINIKYINDINLSREELYLSDFEKFRINLADYVPDKTISRDSLESLSKSLPGKYLHFQEFDEITKKNNTIRILSDRIVFIKSGDNNNSSTIYTHDGKYIDCKISLNNIANFMANQLGVPVFTNSFYLDSHFQYIINSSFVFYINHDKNKKELILSDGFHYWGVLPNLNNNFLDGLETYIATGEQD